MPTPKNQFASLFLGLAGAGLGLVGWACCGLGLTELDILPGFDPIGTADPPPPASTLRSIVEWSAPVCALLGALALPRALRWMLQSPEQIKAARIQAKQNGECG